jgi:Ca-activated chloride channel homolog
LSASWKICYPSVMMPKLSAAAFLLIACIAGAQAPAVRIHSLIFEGNQALDAQALRTQLRISREGAPYEAAILKEELHRLEAHLHNEGFLQAKIGSPAVEFRNIAEKGQVAVIRIFISEGALYTMGELSVRNVQTLDASTLLQMLPLRRGQPYSRQQLSRWREKVREAYVTMGYIRFEAEFHEVTDEGRKVVDCVLDCSEGKAYRVGKIAVVGIPVSEQLDFKKRLFLGEGGSYDPQEIPQSLYFLNSMRIYRPISISDVEVKVDDATATVDLIFHVAPLGRESSMGKVSGIPGPAPAGIRGFSFRFQEPQATIRTEVALVNVIFSAVDRKNRVLEGLKGSDFLVFEDGKPQKIEFFSDLGKKSTVPLTIALLIDTSGSVKTKLEYEKATAAEFFKNVLRKSRDLALIIQFDSEVNLVQDFTDDTGRLIRALDSLQAGNSTSLYDAVFLAVDEKLKSETGRKIIVAITDGEDTSSKLRKEVAIEEAQRNDVLIYGIGVRSDLGTNFGILKRFAEETGGIFFSPHANASEIQAAFRAIGEDLEGQYSLAYSSSNKERNGAFRRIEIRCRVNDVRIRARKGYYAPKGAQKSELLMPLR